MNVKMRQRVEKIIARSFIRAALDAGYLINIDNGDGEHEIDGWYYELPAPVGTVGDVLAAMFATDEERLYLFNPGETKPVGWVFFVYGNDGYDVISDFTTNLEYLMVQPNKLAEKYGG